MLGLKRNTVKLVPYDPEWEKYANESISELSSILGSAAVEIRLVGGAAVPGIRSKPILDIMVGVRQFKDIAPFFPDLESKGYIRKMENDSDSKLFVYANLPMGGDNSDPERRTHYVHIVIHGQTVWNSYTAFCDCLKKDPDLSKKYEQLKESLAARFPEDRRSYTMGKSEFVRRVLRTRCDIKERSCGAVVWRKRGGRRHYLIIQNRSGHSGFPKGHMEYGETEEQTAIREIFEETSLRVRLDTSFRAEYRYLVDGYIHKSALYFLASYTDGVFRPQAGEVFGIWLLPFEDALERLDYEQDRRVLRLAEKRLASDEQKAQ
ncbi:MAG: GrpB family protein [Clostridia bacterium]|nr:GrpB family protein [Clostridia bacterium]